MIYLHIGVHKTATTYLQGLLGTNQGRIAANGRAYWRLFQIRGLLEELVAPELWTKEGVERLQADPDSPFHRFREFVEATRDCVISDENMIGYPGQAIGGDFYPYAVRRLSRISKSLPGTGVEVWLCLRSYDEFLPSAYCEALRTGDFIAPEQFAALHRALPDGRWPALVDAVHKSFPAARLVIWRYEDFRALLPEIASRLSGLSYAELAPLKSDMHPSASREAILHHCEAAPLLKKRTQRILSLAMCEHAYPRADYPDKFYPWEPEVAEAMQAAYRADLAEIGERSYVEMLTPG